jgi:thiol:disulfide interchange protein
MPPRKRRSQKTFQPRLFILGGLAVLIAAVLFAKQTLPQDALSSSPDPVLQPGPSASSLLPEQQFDQAMEEGKPILAFFHSYSCVQCVQMTEIVEQVYPEFTDQVVLVDVDVYNQANNSLLRRARVRAIPTVILIDPAGEGQVYVGVMAAENLRERLVDLSAQAAP